MKQILHFFEQLFLELKDPLIVFFTTLGLFLAPIAEIIFAAILFAFLDFFTALIAAYRRNIPITSEKMGDTFPKIILYSFAIIFVHYLDTFLIQQLKVGFLDHILGIFMDKTNIDNLNKVKLTAAVASLILIREAKSIDENWKLCFGWGFTATIQNYIIKPIFKLKNLINKNGTTTSKTDASTGKNN